MTGGSGLPRASWLGVLLGLTALAPDGPAAQQAAWPRSVVGVADVRLSGPGGRASSRLIYAAAVEPTVLRVEVVRAGRVHALLWCDDTVVRVLVPDDPPLLHEGPPGRETFERALGLPFCAAELVFALRSGLAPEPACGGDGAELVVQRRHGSVVSLRRAPAEKVPPLAVTFERFSRTDGGRRWPRRALLESEQTRAVVTFSTVQERPVPPGELDAAALGEPRRITAEELARVLGVEGREPP